MENNEERRERFILAGVHTGARDVLSDTTEESVKELAKLVETAGGESVGEMIQNKSEIESATYMGEGKLAELSEFVANMDADAVVFDDELSPVQLRNISDILKCKVLDRSMLILDIFALHAHSGEGKLQVELAQLKYRLPRLRGMGAEMSRTGGGIGTRGPGETRLESDRRHIHRRISALEAEIKDMKKHRELIRGRRKKDGTVTAAIVGYTNAGKSTLLNLLTDSDILAEDKLFATLDPTSRALTLEDNTRILLVDTVGFIRKLPHNLVEAFKSTLEEATVADFLIHVIDASDPQMDNNIRVVEQVLTEIGAIGKRTVEVYNKIDKITDYKSAGFIAGRSGSVMISAKSGLHKEKLLKAISDAAPGKKQRVKALIPFSEGNIINELHENQKVISEEYTAGGVVAEVMVDSEMYERIRGYCL